MIRKAVSVLMLVAVANAASAASSNERVLDRSFEVTAGGRLNVDADSADISVTGSDSAKVTVHVLANGSPGSLEDMTITAEQTADGVNVIVKHPGKHWLGADWHFGNNDIRIDVTVPHRYDAELRTSGGDLIVKGLQGDATGRTSGGDVEVSEVQGGVKMKTSGGDIKVGSIQGRVDVQTSGGDIDAKAIRGDLDGKTSGGSVRADEIGGAVKLHSSGGDVQARRINGPIIAHTNGSSIRLEQIDGAIDASTSGGQIKAELIGANRGIRLSTSGSEIVLQLPAAVHANVDASTNSGRVRSDLAITGTLDGDGKYVRGTINGGGEPIYAHTSGGNIVIQQKK